MTQPQTSQKTRHSRTKKVLNASPPTSRVRLDESSPSGPIEGRSFSFRFVNEVRSLASLEDLDEMTVRDLGVCAFLDERKVVSLWSLSQDLRKLTGSKEQWLIVRGTQIFKPDRMKPYLLMNCFGSDQTDLEGTGYFYDSLRECATHFENILKTNPGLEPRFRDNKPGSNGDDVCEEINDQTRRGSDKVPFRECSGSECTNLGDDDSYRTGGSDKSRNTSDETSESSEQDREPCSQDRLSKVTGLLAEYLLPAGSDRNKDYIDVDRDSEHSEWEGHSHPNTNPPSTKSTITDETVDRIWKGDEMVFRNPQKSQNTRSYGEDICQTEGSNATPRKLQKKNFGSKNLDGSRKDPGETHETLGQDQIPRSRDKQ